MSERDNFNAACAEKRRGSAYERLSDKIAEAMVDSLADYLNAIFCVSPSCLHNGPITVIDTLSTETQA